VTKRRAVGGVHVTFCAGFADGRKNRV
jgi:hypothetical protein